MPGLAKPSCDPPVAHPPLPNATAESSLRGGYTREAAGRVGRAEEGRRHRRAKTPPADGGGRGWRNGCVLVHPSHENLAWRVAVEPAWTLNRGLSRLSISSTFTAMEVTEDGTEMVAAERKLPPSHRAGSPPARR